jgi:hypothetical protein
MIEPGLSFCGGSINSSAAASLATPGRNILNRPKRRKCNARKQPNRYNTGEGIVKNLPAASSGRLEVPDLRRFAARVFGNRDSPEPVSAWRTAPESALVALTTAEKTAYINALLPLLQRGRKIERGNLRRLCQLFAMMQMLDGERVELLATLERRSRPAPEWIPIFRDPQVRRSLVEEAEAFVKRVRSNEARDYTRELRVRLKVQDAKSRKLARLLEKLTELENRAAALLGKRGHIVRLEDRRLEIFKKALAAVGVPAAVLFPLGTVGLSVEGISTGLIALGGGLLLPAGIAMTTGLGAAVAVGITTKKLLDMLLPTVDADRASIDVEQLRSGVVEVQRLLDEVVANSADDALREHARERIAHIMRAIAPLTKAQRSRIESALGHARMLGARYITNLRHDGAALEQQHSPVAPEVDKLLAVDLPVVTGMYS